MACIKGAASSRGHMDSWLDVCSLCLPTFEEQMLGDSDATNHYEVILWWPVSSQPEERKQAIEALRGLQTARISTAGFQVPLRGSHARERLSQEARGCSR